LTLSLLGNLGIRTELVQSFGDVNAKDRNEERGMTKQSTELRVAGLNSQTTVLYLIFSHFLLKYRMDPGWKRDAKSDRQS
jgi:hypothetical protein